MRNCYYLQCLYSNYCPRLCCFCHIISAIVLFGLSQVCIDVGDLLEILNSTLYLIYGGRLLVLDCKMFSSEFPVGYSGRCTSEEGRRVQWLGC